MGNVEGLWVPGPLGQYFGKIRFIEKPGKQDQGISMWLNVVLTAYPEVKVQGPDLVRVVGIVVGPSGSLF